MAKMSSRVSSKNHLTQTGLSVLYVEDSEMVRESTLLLMTNYFGHIDTAHDGEAGLRRYHQYFEETSEHYDIVFTDIKMPNMDGLRLSKAILDDSPEQNIVVISAHDESEYLLELINLGISHFILKPIDIQQFDAVVIRISTTIENEKTLRLRQEELLKTNRHLIRARQEAEQASIAKSHFLANMSHEIRTPLNAINGFIHLLRGKETDPEKKNYLDIIQESSQSLLLIISDILDLSKIESGKMELLSVDFAPCKHLLNVGKLFKARAAEEGIALTLDCTDTMPESLHADVLRIKQILFNLLSNAVKFTPKGGTVTVRIGYHDAQLHLQVQDNGIGIAPDRIHQVFEPFVQADSSTSRTYGGTGLGLSISIRLAHMLGGTLTVESRAGEGSLFSLTLPASSPKGSPLSASVTPHPATAPLHILVAEDNESNALFVSIVLKKHGMTCETAANGLEAIAKFRSGHFDLLLMDVNMPELSGIEATQAILAYEKEHNRDHTPIIALTANAILGDQERFLNAGMDGYLSKPIDPQTLIDTLYVFCQPPGAADADA